MVGAATTGRRSLLAGIGGALCGLAGCTGVLGDTDGDTVVSMLAAGSLNNAIENGLRERVDTTLQAEVHGSARCARLVASGQKDPDILSLADVALFDSLLDTEWVAAFATNALVVAYDPESDGGRRLADAERWYEPLVDGTVELGRTDPALDPLGYRALFMLELATEYYDADDNLRETVPTREQIYPETQLVSQFETGAVDAAITYRNMAVERGYDYVALPDEIDLSSPAHAETYRTVSYTLPSGQEIRGGVIGYGSTVRHTSDAAVSVFDAHTTGDYLDEAGFLLDEQFPIYEGDVPERIRDATESSASAADVADVTVLR